MFNLEQSIADWRTHMLAAGIKTPVPLDELESHLREEIEQQMQSGLNAAEAFDSAVEKIGRAHAVQNEFEKAEAAEAGRTWKAGQIWSGAIMGLLQLILIGSVLFNSEMQFGDRLSGLAAIATSFLFAGVSGLLSYRISPSIHHAQTRMALIVFGGGFPLLCWLSIFAPFVLTGHESVFGQWLTAVLWAVCPTLGIFAGFIWGIEAAARRKSMTTELSVGRKGARR